MNKDYFPFSCEDDHDLAVKLATEQKIINDAQNRITKLLDEYLRKKQIEKNGLGPMM